MKKCKIILYHIYDGNAYEFDTMMSATRFLGKNNSGNVALAAKGGGAEHYLTIGSYLVFYKEDFTLDNLSKRLDMIKNSTRRSPVVAHDLMNGSEQVFKSMREAGRILHIDKRTIGRSILSGKDAKGYIFRRQFIINNPEKLPEVIKHE